MYGPSGVELSESDQEAMDQVHEAFMGFLETSQESAQATASVADIKRAFIAKKKLTQEAERALDQRIHSSITQE